MSSKEDTATSFGLVIAYVLPGFTALRGLPFLAGSSSPWGGEASAGLTGFLSGTVEALAAGLTVSAVRWLVVDAFHHRTGLTPPAWDFSLLSCNVSAFEFLVQIHYRYYKFYSNMVVALAWAYATGGYALGWRGAAWYGLLAALFLLASRDCLGKYYDRSGRLLGARGGGGLRSGPGKGA